MNDRDFDNYLALLTGLLRLRSRQQSAIAQELRDHLVEHVAHLEAGGVAHDEAVRLALAEFGDAAALAANFSQLVRARRRRLIMRLTVGSACVLAGLTIGIVALRPQVTDHSQRLVAQENPNTGGGFDDVTKSVLAQGLQAAGAGAAGVGAAAAPASSNEATRQRLATKMEAEFVEMPLGDVISYISDAVGVQFYYDQVGEQAGIVNQPISFRLKAVPAEMVLDLTCRRLGLGYRLRSGVIMISTADALPYEPEVRVYMVPEQAVEELATLIPAMIDVHSWRQSTGQMGAMGGYCAPQGSVAMYGGMGSAMAAPAGMPPGIAETVMGSGGGGPVHNEGTIQVFRGALVISQTPETHQKIEKLLDDLQPVLDKKPTGPSPGATPGPRTSQRAGDLIQSLLGGESSPAPVGRPSTTLPSATPGNTPALTPGASPATAPPAVRPRGQGRPGATGPAVPGGLTPSRSNGASSSENDPTRGNLGRGRLPDVPALEGSTDLPLPGPSLDVGIAPGTTDPAVPGTDPDLGPLPGTAPAAGEPPAVIPTKKPVSATPRQR